VAWPWRWIGFNLISLIFFHLGSSLLPQLINLQQWQIKTGSISKKIL
jgi:hypothetical protein